MNICSSTTCPNQIAGDERLETFNKVFNRSDLINIQLEKEEIRKIKNKKTLEADKRREERQKRKIINEAKEIVLNKHNSTSCGCNNKCSGKCKCVKNDHSCNQYCGCKCKEKTILQ